MSDDLTILYAPRDGWRERERLPATLAITDIAEHYLGSFKRIPLNANTGYADAMESVWDNDGDLVIIEHDMGPTVQMVQALIDCPHPMCAQAYWLAPASTGRPDVILSARTGILWSDWRPLEPGDEWADWAGIGLCKIGPSLRHAREWIYGVPWQSIENEVHRLLGGNQWHVHWPVCPHYHGFQAQPSIKNELMRRKNVQVKNLATNYLR